MKLKNIGEIQLIKKLTYGLKGDSSLIKGIGDDAAVIKYKKDIYLLVTTDILIENVHFKIKGIRPELIGHKALASNISDIAAMGARPRYAVVSLGLPQNMNLKFVRGIYRGIRNLAERYQIVIIGGDTSRADKLVINIALLGFAKRANLTLRETAKVRDRVFVSGYLGGALKGKHLKFNPRLEEALSLIKTYNINSMTDISDGLAQDLYNLIRASNLGAIIYEDKVPLSKDAQDINSALYDGEDFELLFTASKGQSDKIKNYGIKGLNLSEIGEVVSKGKGFKMIDRNGKMKEISLRHVFKHF